VIVDAAAELPPVENLERFISTGADLVAFSGGKAIRGPQTTGILAGRRDLIESVALQNLDMHAADDVWTPPNSLIDIDEYDGVPKQGIGRSNKVGKEELVGLLKALEQFVAEDHDQLRAEWREIADRISAALSEVSGLETTVTGGGDVSVAPEVIVHVRDNTPRSDQAHNGEHPDEMNQEDLVERAATDMVRKLREGDPRVFVGADQLSEGTFTVNPMCLDDDEVDYVIDRIVTAASETLTTP
jgi:L-seryl-tRNA(Ser) seleniumtransferase